MLLYVTYGRINELLIYIDSPVYHGNTHPVEQLRAYVHMIPRNPICNWGGGGGGSATE